LTGIRTKLSTFRVGSQVSSRIQNANIRCNAPTSPGTTSQLKINLAGDTALTVKQFTYPAAVELGTQINKLVGAFKVCTSNFSRILMRFSIMTGETDRIWRYCRI
jgi:hypothetical protein